MINPVTRLARWWLRDEIVKIKDDLNYEKMKCADQRLELVSVRRSRDAWAAEAQDAKNLSNMHQMIANNFQNAQTNWHDDMDALYRDAYPKLTKERKAFWQQKIGLPS